MTYGNRKGLSRLPRVEKHTLIFERPLGGGLFQKATSIGLSAFFWTLWGGLILPFLTYAFWVIAPIFGVDRVVASSEDSIPVLSLLTATGLALGATLIMLGALQWMFGKARPRPAVTKSVTREELAKSHGLQDIALEKSWESRRLVLHHHANSRISKIEVSHPKDAA